MSKPTNISPGDVVRIGGPWAIEGNLEVLEVLPDEVNDMLRPVGTHSTIAFIPLAYYQELGEAKMVTKKPDPERSGD